VFRRLALCVVVLAVPLACGGVKSGEAGDGSGGLEVAEAGGSSTGGEPATTGAVVHSGGAGDTGGAAAFGGQSVGGGVPNTGGRSDVGGTAATGGTNRTGGATAGGAAPTGGSQGTGGMPNDGGVPAGGAPNHGGSHNPGGAPNHGGANHTGGNPGGLPRFVGNTTTNSQVNPSGLNFADYWDQIVPETAGRWWSVQPDPDAAYDWSTLDAIHDYAQENSILFKEHTFIWECQRPATVITQEDVIDWIRSFCERYPDTALIDVVNEPPPHTNPTYIDAMGGNDEGDWQWITNAFTWARQYCPGAVLIINDYNNIEQTNENEQFIELVNSAVAHGAPIDAVGAQAHFTASSLSSGPATIARLLQKLHDDTGLPVYITELDFAGLDDQEQLQAYQQYFPLFRDAEFVPGITLWGWIEGETWRTNSGLMVDGNPRPAMTWLMNELDRPVP